MFQDLIVSHVESSTESAKIISFEIPKDLESAYKYFPGQYVIVHKVGEATTKRCYSICSKAGSAGLQIGVKKVEGGKMSPFLVDDLKEGDTLSVSYPEGNFRLLTDSLSPQSYVFIAAGSGITPIRSMIDHVLQNEPRSKVTLIYGNRDKENIIFGKYFDEIQDKKQVSIVHCLDQVDEAWEGERGILSQEKLAELITKYVENISKSKYFVCGPPAVLSNAEHSLELLNIKKSNIFLEYFTIESSADGPQNTEPALVEVNTPTGRNSIPVEPGESILDATIRNGLGLPYSCKQGICSSCKQKKVSGPVQVLQDFGLSEKEKEEGYVLLCQSFPLGPDVVIECTESGNAVLAKKKSNRRLAIAAGVLCSLILLAGFAIPAKKTYLALGEMNKGHEDLACGDCHSDSKGTMFQQLNANAKFLFGQRKEAVNFGSDDVDNKKCLNCHNRPNDRHPVHRFKEPRFADARKNLGAENCESCHSEHKNQRIVLTDLAYCQECHSDTEITEDPLDIPHTTLITNGEWKTCLQCHDFHGNHVMVTPHLMQDTIPFKAIELYARGGADPYGSEKKHIAASEIEEIKKMIK